MRWAMIRWSILGLALLLAGCQGGPEVLVQRADQVGPPPASTAKAFVCAADSDSRRVGIAAGARLTEGTAWVEALGPSGESLFKSTFEPGAEPRAVLLPPPSVSGSFDVSIELADAVGSWELSLVRIPEPSFFHPFALTGPLVLVVVMLALWLGRRWHRTKLRWLGLGAGLWTVAVALKGTSDYFLGASVLAALERALPRWAYLPTGSLYVGMHSALYEIGLTALAALVWRRLAAEPRRAIHIGLGAGAFEAALVGLLAAISAITVLRGEASSTISMTQAAALTPGAWLVAPVERALTIPLHVASRLLVFYGVASRRWRSLLMGFVLFAAIDSVAGAALVAKLTSRVSLWWIEAAIVPFTLLSVWVARKLPRRWPPGEAERAAVP